MDTTVSVSDQVISILNPGMPEDEKLAQIKELEAIIGEGAPEYKDWRKIAQHPLLSLAVRKEAAKIILDRNLIPVGEYAEYNKGFYGNMIKANSLEEEWKLAEHLNG